MPKPDGGAWNVQEGAVGPQGPGMLLSNWILDNIPWVYSELTSEQLAAFQAQFAQLSQEAQQGILGGLKEQYAPGNLASQYENLPDGTRQDVLGAEQAAMGPGTLFPGQGIQLPIQGFLQGSLDITQTYQESLGRAPSTQEIQGWQSSGQTSQQIRQSIQGSPEAAAHGGGPLPFREHLDAAAPSAPPHPQPAPPHPQSGYTPPGGGVAGGGVAGGGGAGGGYSPPDAPRPDSTSNTAGEYGTFATQAKNLFGPTGLATYGETTPWGERFLSDELTQVQATGGKSGGPGDPYAGNWTKGGGMTGYTFNGVSGADIQRVLGMAEKWSALTGWKYFPPAQVIQILAGQNDLSQQSANEQFWQQLPQSIQQKVPGVEFGQDPTQFLQTTNSFQEAYANWTGAKDLDPGIIKDFLTKGGGQYDATMFDQWVQNDPATRARAPWMTRGLSYQDWQRHMADPNNIHTLQNRFGTDPSQQNQANFLTDFMKPEFKVDAQGAAPITPQQRGGRQASSGSQSEVR